jgi:predicted transcriptional regulator of viral defense system
MVAQYIEKLLSVERYSFSLKELLKQSNKSSTALRRELDRLVEKDEIINLRQHFYLIITPRYRTLGKLPVNLYVTQLFHFLEKNYYVGFYTAAKIYGASHQQAQRDYVMTQPPQLLDVKKAPIDVRFLTTKEWPKGNIIAKKSDAGTYQISTPALTLVDLIRYQNKMGGLNRMLSTIEELLEEVTEKDISELLRWYSHKATLQRLGFLMNYVDEENGFSELILGHLSELKTYPILLQPNSKQRPGAVNNPFKVDINLTLENDL